MSFDLTNKNIQDTFQNLLQKTGSEGKLFDLVGNEITDLTIGGTLTAHSYITSESIVNTSSGSTAFGNSSDDTHKFIGNITASGNISASGDLIIGGSTTFGDSTADTHQFTGSINASGSLVLGDGDDRFFIDPQGAGGQVHIGTSTNDLLFFKVNGNNALSINTGAKALFYQDVDIRGNTHIGSDGAGDLNVSGHITASGNISASGHISASKFVGDGSELTGLSSAAISSYTNNGNNRIVTSVNSTTVNSEANLTFDGTALNVNGELTSSKVLVNAPNPTDDFFLLKSGSLDSLKVNNQGVLVLGGFTYTPTAVRGGLYYDQDDDEFYAGKNN